MDRHRHRPHPPVERKGIAHDEDISLFCLRCGAHLKPGEGSFYVVRIEALADPSGPRITEQDMAADFDAEFEKLIAQARQMSETELMESVYRRLTIHLCRPCYTEWIENPTGG